MTRTTCSISLSLLLAAVVGCAGEPAPTPEKPAPPPPAADAKGFFGALYDTIKTPEERKDFGIASDEGVFVVGVFPGHAAQAAGLKVADYVTKINGRKVDSPAAATGAASACKPGQTIEIEYVYGGFRAPGTEGTRMTGKATLGARPDDETVGKLIQDAQAEFMRLLREASGE